MTEGKIQVEKLPEHDTDQVRNGRKVSGKNNLLYGHQEREKLSL